MESYIKITRFHAQWGGPVRSAIKRSAYLLVSMEFVITPKAYAIAKILGRDPPAVTIISQNDSFL